MISPDSYVVVAPDQLCSNLDGEAVILDLKDGTYYGLNEVGARIWALIQQPFQVAALVEVLLAEYDVEAAQCEHEVLTLLGQLAARGLIEVSRAARAPVSATQAS